MSAHPLPAARTPDIWRLREAESASRVIAHLLCRLRSSLREGSPPPVVEVILFGEASAILDNRATASLLDRSEMLQSDPAARVVIGGFASPSGSAAHEMELGFRRVRAIRSFLLAHGVDPGRIEVAIRGTRWLLTDRCRGAATQTSVAECRLQIADPQWALSRN